VADGFAASQQPPRWSNHAVPEKVHQWVRDGENTHTQWFEVGVPDPNQGTTEEIDTNDGSGAGNMCPIHIEVIRDDGVQMER
jgi:hypothetical protein